jgi:branched-chain amino acid transport system permease protein
VFWLATLLPFWLFPDYLVLASQIAITALFALSLDLILGYAGIVSLGHAAFFGLGAYTAGLIAKAGWGEPLSGLLLGALVAGLVGYAASFIISRFRHLALIMITLGMCLLLEQLANSASWLTGGADGLQGVKMWPIFNTFRFDLYGKVAYTYSLIALFSCSSWRGASSIRRSACRCAVSARTSCACRRSARRAARTCARSTPSPP